MKKWPVTLSTTEPFNYIGIVKVRQGNINSEVLSATIIENGQTMDLTGYKATFQSVVGKFPVERACSIADPKKGIVEYIFDDYTMQEPGRHIANIALYKGETFVASSQDFSYFVIQAVSKTDGEMGSYWQSVDDLINDMEDFINAGQGDFQAWFDSVKDILSSIDPGGALLAEIVDARKDIDGAVHPSLTDRLESDFDAMEKRLKDDHYTLETFDVSQTVILQDDSFSERHQKEIVGTVDNDPKASALVIGPVSATDTGVYYFEKVGVLDGQS